MMAPAAETLHVTGIHSLARRNDARYVAAALRAISGVTHRPLAITTIPETATLPEATAVLFWLNKAAPPETVVTRVQAGLVLVVDAEGEDWQDVQRRIFLEQEGSGVSGLLLKRRVDALYGGQARWKDSAGEPLLERFVSGAGVVYRFYSRFHPSSGAFVHTAAFPEGLWSLLFEGTAHTVSRSDRRRISAVQRMPVRRAERVFRESNPAPVRLHEPVWVLVFILFAVERWVAHRQSGG